MGRAQKKIRKKKSREQQVSTLFCYRKDLNKFLLTWVMYKQVISFSFRGSWLETGLQEYNRVSAGQNYKVMTFVEEN